MNFQNMDMYGHLISSGFIELSFRQFVIGDSKHGNTHRHLTRVSVPLLFLFLIRSRVRNLVRRLTLLTEDFRDFPHCVQSNA